MREIHIHRGEGDIAGRKSRLQLIHVGAAKAAIIHYFNQPEDLTAPILYEDRAREKALDRLLLIDHQFEGLSDVDGEQPAYDGSDYEDIRRFLKIAGPKPGDVIYDLGAGYGRVILMGAITHTDVTFKGIELVADRVRDANEVREKFELENAEFIHGNVRDVDFSEGNIFYMFNPFTNETLNIVMSKLSAIARNKRILIATTWMGRTLDINPWLRPFDPHSKSDPQLFESSWPEPFFPERLEELQAEISKSGYLERDFTHFHWNYPALFC